VKRIRFLRSELPETFSAAATFHLGIDEASRRSAVTFPTKPRCDQRRLITRCLFPYEEVR
jgi:hypothetical protein